jgi:hypothetical protein
VSRTTLKIERSPKLHWEQGDALNLTGFRGGGDEQMIIYEFYWRDEAGRDFFVGTLKERRKNSERITEESILNWGRKSLHHDTEDGDFYFYISETDEA